MISWFYLIGGLVLFIGGIITLWKDDSKYAFDKVEPLLLGGLLIGASLLAFSLVQTEEFDASIHECEGWNIILEEQTCVVKDHRDRWVQVICDVEIGEKCVKWEEK